ncbi:MAG TPA: CHAD domain-containing protein [Candidatus Polarisedimenticolia bacterium]|nr:CHAD domain-containing protein [Candidatus Polarisedimenticolia bacterium]
MALIALGSTTTPPKSIGLEIWMERVLERATQVERGWDADDVHDLRVALRRCRTMADALGEVNPGPAWRKLKKTSRELFHDLGDLRDAQVMRAWVKKLGPAGDPVRRHMLRLLSGQERQHRASVQRALERFDRKEWKKLARKSDAKAHFFPLESVVFQRLALTKLNAAAELYRQARQKRSSIAWHRLRIGIKRFRYIVDNFLPQRSQVWAGDLKRVQDLLGEVHDLDVLRSAVRRQAPRLDRAIVAGWYARIEGERKARLEEFIARMTGPESLWLIWRAGLQRSQFLVGAPLAKRRTA